MSPDVFTNEELMLDVGDGHQLYVHDWGNKAATKPILFLHGGPGGGCSDSKKSFFDPASQRVIFFDQRGSGRSLPYGSLEHNDTAHQLEDIDRILDTFGIDQVILMGSSWGSALAFFYGIARPQRVRTMVLSGIWTTSERENDWVDGGGFQTFYPDAWQKYLDKTPLEHRGNPTAYHFDRILSDDATAVSESGYAYQSLEAAVMSLDDRPPTMNLESFDPTGVRIEVHYLAHKCFVADRFVFDNAAKLTMPIYMVQGRYDMVCPPITAYELANALPNAKLIWTTSGHRAERETWNIKRTILAELTAE